MRNNLITDVPGLCVGHITLASGNIQTGVTAILPHKRNLFKEKVPAAVHVINGFGKSVGLIQVAELGNIESPILLSNTFAMASCLDGGLDIMLDQNPDIALKTGSINIVALECNDAYLSDMRSRPIKPEHVRQAINLAANSPNNAVFEQGSVGAGRGMTCYGFKGGIGSASKDVEIDGNNFVLGTLVLSNFGRKHELTVRTRPTNKNSNQPSDTDTANSGTGKEGSGSVIIILATNAPLDSRQLHRLCVRASSGLARTGATIWNGSGEIALAFSTAHTIPHYAPQPRIMQLQTIHEDDMDILFEAVTTTVEESVINSLFFAKTVIGRDGHEREKLIF